MTTPDPPVVTRDIPAAELKVLYARTAAKPRDDDGLRDSLREKGQLTALLVAADLTVLNGHRRYALGCELGLPAFRCDVDSRIVTDAQKVAAIVHCDLQSRRHWLDTSGLLHARLLSTGNTQKELAADMNFSPALVSRYLAPLDFGEVVLRLARDGRLTLKHFQAAKTVSGRDRQTELLLKAGRDGLSAPRMLKLARSGQTGRGRPRCETFRHGGFVLTFPAGSVREVEAGMKALHTALRDQLRSADKSELPAATVLGHGSPHPAEPT